MCMGWWWKCVNFLRLSLVSVESKIINIFKGSELSRFLNIAQRWPFRYLAFQKDILWIHFGSCIMLLFWKSEDIKYNSFKCQRSRHDKFGGYGLEWNLNVTSGV